MNGLEYFSKSDGSHFCDYCPDETRAVIVRKHTIKLAQGMDIDTIFLCQEHARKLFPSSLSKLHEVQAETRVRVFDVFDWITCPLCDLQFSDNSARTDHVETAHSDYFERERILDRACGGEN